MSSVVVNTGNKIISSLVERYVDNNSLTGRRKPNLPNDPNYIEPVEDLIACPIISITQQISVTAIYPNDRIQDNILGPWIANITLIRGLEEYTITTPGIFNFIRSIYSGVLFDVIDGDSSVNVSYYIYVKYRNHLQQIVNNICYVNRYQKTLLTGPFDQILEVGIINQIGSFSDDYSADLDI